MNFRIIYTLFVIFFLSCGFNSYGQGTVTRPAKQQFHTTKPKKSKVKPDYNGHDYVDLGLPSGVKWATCNVGASSPEEYGDYFAWGEISPKIPGNEGNSETYGKNIKNITGNSLYDAARAKWGGSWRLPTKTEIQELRANCTSEWTTQGGAKGRRFTSKRNGNSIFLPAAGLHGKSFIHVGESGNYWSSSPDDMLNSYGFHFGPGGGYVSGGGRDIGLSVRPVSE